MSPMQCNMHNNLVVLILSLKKDKLKYQRYIGLLSDIPPIYQLHNQQVINVTKVAIILEISLFLLISK